MVPRRSLLLIGAITVLMPAVRAIEPTPGELEKAQAWSAARLSAHDPAALSFSFRYDGRPSREFLPSWTIAERDEPPADDRTRRTITMTDPKTGLVVRGEVTSFQTHPAIEYVLWFENTGQQDTPIIEDVQALDAGLGDRRDQAAHTLHHAEGSHEKITDFQPRETVLRPGDHIELSSFGGRSSDGSLPFFNLAHADAGGTVIAIGWTGQWAASFRCETAGRLFVRAGMERTHLRLHPGEKIRTPAILLLFWDGPDYLRGQNLLRKLLLAHYTPRPNGKEVQPPCAASPHAVVRFEGTTEANMREGIRNIAAHHVPFDHWWIDTGWFTCGTNWARYVGNPDPDPVRFPNGLKPVADEAHRAGMKFLLWFEPERVMPDTWLHQHHRDWLLRPSNDMPAELKYQINDGFHLLDLGNPEARAWVKAKLSGMIGSIGIDCYRNDFNMYPVYYWRNDEAPDRQGMREIAYVMGLYDLFDTLQREHPGLLLDNCASGGRRIDFEMLRRALVLTRSDYLWGPIGQQCHTFGLAQWLPITGIGAASLDRYSQRSGLGSHYTLAADYYSRDENVWKQIAQVVTEWQATHELYSGNFYPLTPYSTSPRTWLAWQFDRPDRGEGLVQAFRRPDCTEIAQMYRLHGLDPVAEYSVIDIDSKRSLMFTGRELMDQGLPVRLEEAPGAALVLYRKR